jgi:chromatin segregation and condensation protein Rec8/ScpA/Scc1 (kleisin family)
MKNYYLFEHCIKSKISHSDIKLIVLYKKIIKYVSNLKKLDVEVSNFYKKGNYGD